LGGSISPDGSQIAFVAFGFGQEMWMMRSDGTSQVKIAADKGSWNGLPTWSPDGERIAYIRSTELYATRRSSVQTNESRTQSIHTLFSDNSLGPSLCWLPSGRLVYTIGEVDNLQHASLWVTSPKDPKGGPTRRISTGTGWASHLTGSNDGKVLTFIRENSLSSINVGAIAPDGAQLLEKRK